MIRNFSRRLMSVAIACLSLAANAQTKLPQLGKDPVSEIVKAMTLEEKVQLVTGTGLRFAGSGPVIGDADGRVPGAAGNTINLDRFGIPGTVLADGPAGVRIDPYHKGDSTRSYYATAWPVGTLLASSWDTALVKKVGIAFGNEVKEYGVDVILAPGMNIQRNPLNGRNFEYYSEDPLLSGWMAASMVKGMQSNGIGTSIKHFAANNGETNRNSINAIISERALREIYLKNFEIAVKNGHPMTVMSSYNKLNGIYTSENPDLLTTVLREEWGFKGMVMTDWYGGHDAAAQVKAGNDLLEPGSKHQQQTIMDAIKAGTLDIKDLDRNVARVLEFILKTPSFDKYKYSNAPDLKAHALVARNAAAESMVLLKNNGNVLPIQKNAKIALFGNGSYATIRGGTGSGEVNTAYTVSIDQGLANAGYQAFGPLADSYKAHILADQKAHPHKGITLGPPHLIPEQSTDELPLAQAADNADMAIYAISRNAGEGNDRKVDNDFNLSAIETANIKAVTDAFHAKGKKVLVILNIGGAVETASWRDESDAILLAWQPGEEGGNAVADVVTGTVNPSGKLANTFPVKYDDEPSAGNFPGEPVGKMPTQAVYKEGIYVGYRYFNSFHVQTAFPFGFGLSYTKFKYSGLKISAPDFKKRLTVTLTVTNTGSIAGKEIVQLYLSAPHKNLDKPAEELKGFAKTALLKPGASQTVTFTIRAADLASFNTDQSEWIAESGKYTVGIGASSEDIKLSGTFHLAGEMVVEKVHKAIVPQVQIDELKNK
jgi:beta-glucosidase